MQCFDKRFHDFDQIQRKNITDFHAKNLNNSPPPENVDNKDGSEVFDNNVIVAFKLLLFWGKQDKICWIICNKVKSEDIINNFLNDRTN